MKWRGPCECDPCQISIADSHNSACSQSGDIRPLYLVQFLNHPIVCLLSVMLFWSSWAESNHALIPAAPPVWCAAPRRSSLREAAFHPKETQSSQGRVFCDFEPTRNHGPLFPSDDWRRTNRGWEHTDSLFLPNESPPLPPITGVHPLVVAGLEILGCIGAYSVFSLRARRRRTDLNRTRFGS